MLIEQIKLDVPYEKLKLNKPEEEIQFTGYILQNSHEYCSDRKRPALIICPGGGYRFTSDREATPIALEFVAKGISCFVLRYSVQPNQFPTALLELCTAVKTVRDNHQRWNIDPDKIVVCGFSAGGHLAASLGVFWNHDLLAPIANFSEQNLRAPIANFSKQDLQMSIANFSEQDLRAPIANFSKQDLQASIADFSEQDLRTPITNFSKQNLQVSIANFSEQDLRVPIDNFSKQNLQASIADFSEQDLRTPIANFSKPDMLTPINSLAEQFKPNALILCYPVITAGEYAHSNSFVNLLGEERAKIATQRDIVSLEKHVSSSMPPTFLWHTYSDSAVPVENSLLLASAIATYKVPLELHIYPKGGHGLSLANELVNKSIKNVPTVNSWIHFAFEFIKNL